MFNAFSKNFTDSIPCQSFGSCTTDPIMNALDELILQEIRQISFYAVKAKEFGYSNHEIFKKTINVLCLSFNNSYCPKNDYLKLFSELVGNKKIIKEVYKNFCKNNPRPSEMLTDFPVRFTGISLMKMIIEGEKFLDAKNKFILKDNVQLLDLIVILSKLASVNISKIREYQPDFMDYDFEVLRFFNLTNFPSTRKEKLKRRIKEFLKVSYEIEKKLDSVLTDVYGSKITTEISTDIQRGKSILVCGDNLKELELILEKTKDKDINVYTYEFLFYAHLYPKFQSYKNLKGHFGSDDVSYDFSNFEGPVFSTKYYNQKIDNIYRGSIYTSNVFTPRGTIKIKEGDFDCIIKKALETEGFKENIKGENILIHFDKKYVENTINKADNDITVLVGGLENKKISELTKNKNVLILDNPVETELLFFAIEKAMEKNLNTDIIFTKCSIRIASLALAIKSQNIGKIYLMKCPKYNINPQILECLKRDFDVIILDN